MKVSFSFWSNPIGDSYYFCKPHTENVAFNWMDLGACLVLFTFEAIQLGIVVTFISHPEIEEFTRMKLYACLMPFIFEANQLLIHKSWATCIFQIW